MDEKELYPSLIEKLNKDFSLEKDLFPIEVDFAQIRNYLILKVKELMGLDYQRFLNSLYRIDVDENKVREIIHSRDITSIPERLADLIIDRQLMRVRTQILYKQSKLE